MTWQDFRERVNLRLFKHKDQVLGIFKGLNIAFTVLSLGTLIWMYGFALSAEDEQFAFFIIKSSFGFYVFHYLVRIIYDFHPVELIRKTWFEGLMMGVLLVEGLFHMLTGNLLLATLFEKIGISGFSEISTVLIQLYFMVVVITEFVKNSELLPTIRLNPAVIFVLSFVIIIGSGTFLLMLPQMTTNGISFSDALFTSTSSTCVTGLLTVDPQVTFTFKGQFVILALIKIGGTNIIAFGGFLALVSKLGVGVKHHSVIEGFVNRDNILSAKGMLGKVILWTTSIELVGATAMYFLWSPDVQWYDNGQRIFYSIFHAMSAFNNAGIALFTDGFYNETLRTNYLVHWVIILEIFFGALGILAIFDLFEPKSLRDRLKHPWKQINFSTKIALYFSLWLVGIGAAVIFLLERDNTLAGQSLFGQITGAVFAAVTPRTAGYNTINYAVLSVPTIMVTMALMYVGASSSSTGGGIKTSSLAIIWADMKAAMTGREHAVLYKRTITSTLKTNAYSIAIIYIVMNFIGALLLSISEKHILAMPGRSGIDLVFEQVSAFSTVGLSLGITSSLSEMGKYILVGSMFVGRVGTFTIAFALAGKFVQRKYKYPEAETVVG
jgi:trk system potassium uptake protein